MEALLCIFIPASLSVVVAPLALTSCPWANVFLLGLTLETCLGALCNLWAHLCLSVVLAAILYLHIFVFANPALLACFTLPAVSCLLMMQEGWFWFGGKAVLEGGKHCFWELVRAIQHVVCGRQLPFPASWCAEVLVKHRMSSYWGVRVLLLAMMKCLERRWLWQWLRPCCCEQFVLCSKNTGQELPAFIRSTRSLCDSCSPVGLGNSLVYKALNLQSFQQLGFSCLFVCTH